MSPRQNARRTASRIRLGSLLRRHDQLRFEQLERRELLSVSPENPRMLTDTGALLYFEAGSGTDRELWKTDGTAQGTVIVKEIVPGLDGPGLYELTNVGGTLYFVANDEMGDREVWKTDGTEAGTVVVKDILEGGSSGPAHLMNFNGLLYFVADDALTGEELWKSDGTEAGTVLVKELVAGSASYNPYELTNVNGTLFFDAKAVSNFTQLWKSDGTELGTELITQLTTNGRLQNWTAVGDKIYFTLLSPTTGGEDLWVSDGTEDGTDLLLEGSSDQLFEHLAEFNGELVFGTTNRNGIELPVHLWKSDGTALGTVQVKEFQGTGPNRTFSELVNVNGTLFFGAVPPTAAPFDFELWTSDGTEEGTVLLKEIRDGDQGSAPSYLVNVGGTLFFSATAGSDFIARRNLWKSDGTEAGTVVVKEVGDSLDFSGPTFSAYFDGEYYYQDDGEYQNELWKSDGTADGTYIILPFGTASLPFTDDFNRDDSTHLGAFWVETDGDVAIIDNRMVLFANTEATAVLNNMTAADAVATIDVDLTGAEVGRSIGIMLRSQGPEDANAYWGLFYKSDSAYAVQIYKNIGGTATPLRSISVPGPTGTLRFEAIGTTLNLYFNGVLTTSVIDDSLTAAGAVGFRQTGGGFDNFSAEVGVPPLSQNAVLPFTDDFNRPNNSLLGPEWTERSGDAGVLNNAAGLFANDTSLITLNGVVEADVSVSADFDVSTTPEQYSSGLIARYGGPGDKDYYLARLYHSGGDSFAAQIWKNVGGVYTPLRSVGVAGGTGTMRFDVVGNQLALYFNNVLVASTIDTSIAAAGQVGFRLSGGTADNFHAEELLAPPFSNATIPFTDDFNRADSSSLGEFWTEQAGDLGVTGNQMKLYAGETSVATVNGISVADVDVEGFVNLSSGGGNVGLLARYSGPGDSNGYLALLQKLGSGGGYAAQLWKNTGSGWVNIAHTEFTPLAFAGANLRFRLQGNQLQLFVGVDLLCDIIDNDIAGPGGVGVRMSGGVVDDFSVA